MTIPRILFRVDGGRVWGVSLGHLMRSLIIAKQLLSKYCVSYVMKDYPDGIQLVRDLGIEVFTIATGDDSDETIITLAEKIKPAVLIFDLRINPYTRLYDWARENSVRSVVFEITPTCQGAPDVLINESFVKEFTHYTFTHPITQYATGPQYFFLESLPAIVPLRQEVSSIMVTMGGSDPAGLTEKIVSTLLDWKYFLYTIRVVLGPAFVNISSIERPSAKDSRIQILQNPAEFHYLLSSQDIVITSAGRTLYECACLGRPVIVVPSIEHEAITAESFSKLTGNPSVGFWQDTLSPDTLRRNLDSYLDYQERLRVSERSCRLVDGKGLERVISLIEADG